MAYVLELWHLAFCVAVVVQIHGAFDAFAQLTSLILLHHCGGA